MGQWIVWVLDILLYLAEGYCIQFFFGRFAKPKLHGLKYAEWASGITWIAVRAASEGLFLGMGGGIRFLKLLVSSMVLFVFCMCWYQGNLLLKIFLGVHVCGLGGTVILGALPPAFFGKRLNYAAGPWGRQRLAANWLAGPGGKFGILCFRRA